MSRMQLHFNPIPDLAAKTQTPRMAMHSTTAIEPGAHRKTTSLPMSSNDGRNAAKERLTGQEKKV